MKNCPPIQLLLPILALLSVPVPGSADEELLRGIQSSSVRAQLVPLQKGAFSAGISAIVESISVQEGDSVSKGQLLLAFDCDDIQAVRKTAEAKVASAQAKLEVNRELVKLNSVGPLEVKLNEAELAVAEGEREQALAKLKHCEVHAPFAGAITRRLVETHQYVEEGAEMLELVSRDSLEVRMLMPSTALAWLRPGTGFEMYVEELNRSMPGEVVRIGGAVDPVSLTVPVFGRLKASESTLLPGMSGRVEFTDLDADDG